MERWSFERIEQVVRLLINGAEKIEVEQPEEDSLRVTIHVKRIHFGAQDRALRVLKQVLPATVRNIDVRMIRSPSSSPAQDP